VHTLSPGVLFTLSPSYHFNRAAFEGLGAADQRLVTTDNRASSYAGGQVSVNVVQGRHNASIGFYGFAQHDNTLFGLNGTSFDDSTVPPSATLVTVPLTRQKVDGDLEAVWIQDQYKASSWLSLTAGVRFTRFAGLVTETAGSPRLGIAVQIPHLHWVLRGAYSRYYQAPPLDTVSSDVLTAVSPGQGFLPLRGERDEQHDVGLTIPVRGWVFDFDHFRTHIREQHRTVRPGNKIAQLQNSDAVQTTFHAFLLFFLNLVFTRASRLRPSLTQIDSRSQFG